MTPLALPGAFLYTTGYKHRTERAYTLQTGIVPPVACGNGFVSLDMAGGMAIAPQYSWNGASGPVWETRNSIIASAFHDAGYQMMREGLVPLSYRAQFDDLLYRTLVAAGMWPLRAAVWHLAVTKFGLKHALPHDPEILEAP